MTGSTTAIFGTSSLCNQGTQRMMTKTVSMNPARTLMGTAVAVPAAIAVATAAAMQRRKDLKAAEKDDSKA
jgi:hypothetical protein